MEFKAFIDNTALLSALQAMGYSLATPIQEQLYAAFQHQQDILAQAPTGSGKTEAFTIPLLADLLRNGKRAKSILILAPTRELAIQITERINQLAGPLDLSATAIFGGATYAKQVLELAENPQFIVATPGRLLDLLQQKMILLDRIEVLVVDEMDHMLDLGFLGDVQAIIGQLPKLQQRIFTSATLAPHMEKIALKALVNPILLNVEPRAQQIQEFLLFVDKNNKKNLIPYLMDTFQLLQVIIFTRTIHGVDRLVKFLTEQQITAAGLYGDKSQSSREQILEAFRKQNTRVLVATDIATRGIDIPHLSAIINYEVPDQSETYTHRIGRTGRQRDGIAFTFCDAEDNAQLIKLQTQRKKTIPVYEQHPYVLSWQEMLSSTAQKNKPKKKGKRNT